MGVRVGQTVAAARAKWADLPVRVVSEEAIRWALERLAEASMAFGPVVALDLGNDVVWVEIGGCGHLHGGDRGLAYAIDARVRALGHACRVAIADGPRIASAVARFSSANEGGPFVVPEGQGVDAMGELPIAALGLDVDVEAWLSGLGLHSCGELQKLPRRAFGTRLGPRVHDVLALLEGDDRAPIHSWIPPQVPEERLDLEWGASSIEALGFVVKTLSDRLAMRLEGRAMAASRLELVLDLDRALCDPGGSPRRIEVSLPSPLVRASDLMAVMRARLEREALPAPVLSATLRALGLASSEGRTLDLLAPQPKADLALPRLVAELAAELGATRVGTLEIVDTWCADQRTRLVSFGVPHPASVHSLVTTALEPSRIVRPIRMACSSLHEPELLMRIEAVQWWRHGAASARRDWMAAWTSAANTADIPESAFWGLGWFEVLGWAAEEGGPRGPGGAADAWLRGWID